MNLAGRGTKCARSLAMANRSTPAGGQRGSATSDPDERRRGYMKGSTGSSGAVSATFTAEPCRLMAGTTDHARSSGGQVDGL